MEGHIHYYYYSFQVKLQSIKTPAFDQAISVLFMVIFKLVMFLKLHEFQRVQSCNVCLSNVDQKSIIYEPAHNMSQFIVFPWHQDQQYWTLGYTVENICIVSAYKRSKHEDRVIYFMYNRNSKRPKIEPCGTPVKILHSADSIIICNDTATEIQLPLERFPDSSISSLIRVG